MGILYEHWDPLTNECFYVGASWTNEDARPNDFSPRNKRGGYDKRVENIYSAGLKPEVRLIECSHLSDEELDELEILQIAYWRNLIGDRLTNVSKGGRMGRGFAWSDEMRAESRAILVAFYETPEGAEMREHLRQKALEQFGTEAAKDAHSDVLKKFFETDEGIQWCLDQRQRKLDFYNTPEGEVWKKEHGAAHSVTMTEVWKTDEHRAKMDAFYASPRGAEWRDENSAMVSDLWQTHEYRMKMLPERWYQTNVRYQRYYGA